MSRKFKDHGPKPHVVNIEELTKDNINYRSTIWTGKYLQLTVMNILPGEDIGLEVHEDHDQFIRVEEGEGIAQMGDASDNLTFQEKVKDDDAIFIPAGKWHNVVNNTKKPLKIYSIYSPAEHPKGTIHETKQKEKMSKGGKLKSIRRIINNIKKHEI